MLAESLSDPTQLSLSGLQPFEDLKKFHEEKTLAFIRGSRVFLLSGQRLLKRPISVQLATMLHFKILRRNFPIYIHVVIVMYKIIVFSKIGFPPYENDFSRYF